MPRTCLLMACVAAAALAHAAEGPAMHATGFLHKTAPTPGGEAPYILYVPAGYSPEQAWPLVVFLHGAGERGDNPWLAAEVGLGRAIRNDPAQVPALVLFPLCPAEKFWDSAIPAIETAMADTRRDYRVDDARIYLTGLSMGGYMTWLWGARKTDTFAALLPICGGGNLLDIKLIIGAESDYDFGTLQERVAALATVPIHAFHGADDDVVPPQRSQEIVRMVTEAGGNVKYREYPKTGHNSWDQAYGSPRTWKWLFEQRRN
jgi:predicted peptidase